MRKFSTSCTKLLHTSTQMLFCKPHLLTLCTGGLTGAIVSVAVIVPVWRFSSQTKPTNGFSYRMNKVPTSCQGPTSFYSNCSCNHRAICHTYIFPSATLQTQTDESFIWVGDKNEIIPLFWMTSYILINLSKAWMVPFQTFIHHRFFFSSSIGPKMFLLSHWQSIESLCVTR